jgi:electron transport complex protein RnfB
MRRTESRRTQVAVIDEQLCIGCTFCIQACPVDAIVGAPNRMHTVIAAECTGCKWCLPPCPVDCISMVETGELLTHDGRKRRAALYKQRHAARRGRIERERAEQLEADRRKTTGRKKRATIERAMRRARQRLNELNRSSGKA